MARIKFCGLSALIIIITNLFINYRKNTKHNVYGMSILYNIISK